MDTEKLLELKKRFLKINSSKRGFMSWEDTFEYEIYLIYLASICKKFSISSSDFEKLLKYSKLETKDNNNLYYIIQKNEKILMDKLSSENSIQLEIDTIDYLKRFEINDLIKFIYEDNYDMMPPFGARSSFISPKTLCQFICRLFGKTESSINFLDVYSGMGTIGTKYYLYNNNANITECDINIYNYNIAALIGAIANKDKIKNKNIDFLKDEEINYDEKFDFIFADTPLGLKYDNSLINEFEHINKKFSLEGKKISIPWLSAIKVEKLLKDDGKAIIVSSEGSLFNVLDQDIRKQFVEKNNIEEIIKLPPKILPYTGIPIYFIIISKKNNKIKFVDISNCINEIGRLNEINVSKAMETVDNDAKEIEIEEIVNNDYSLDVNRYVHEDAILIENGIPLGEVSENIFRGYQITASQVDDMITKKESKNTCKLLEISNIDNEGNIADNLKIIDTQGKDFSKFLLQDGDLLLSARGDNTKIAVAKIEKNEKIIPNGSIVVVRTMKEKLDPKYLYIFLNSNQGQLILKTIKTGITIPSLNIGPLAKVEVKCPSMKEQQQVIDKYDIKLELYKISKAKTEKLKQQLDDITNEI